MHSWYKDSLRTGWFEVLRKVWVRLSAPDKTGLGTRSTSRKMGLFSWGSAGRSAALHTDLLLVLSFKKEYSCLLLYFTLLYFTQYMC